MQVIVTDVRGLANTVMTTATVLTQGEAVTNVIPLAVMHLERGRTGAAVSVLESFLNQLDALVRAGQVPAADVAPVAAAIRGVLQSLRP